MNAERYVRENYKNMTDKELSVVLNITAREVRSIRDKNGLKKVNHHMWTEKEKQYIFKNINTHTCEEMGKMFYEKFSAKVTTESIKSLCRDNGVKKHENISYTEEEDQWLIVNISRYKYEELLKMYNEKFNKKRTYDCLKMHCRLILKRTRGKHRFQKGEQVTDMAVKTIVKANGYFKIKVNDDMYAGQENWEFLHRYIYKQHFGEIPEGGKVIFLDGDKNNFDIENLACVDNGTLVRLNKLKFKSDNADVTKSGIKYCELCDAMKEQP